MQTLAPLDILTSGGAYPEREQSPECTSQVRSNAADLAERVSKLLDFLGVKNPKISSGFRTVQSNAASRGATNSSHLEGRAVDIFDLHRALNARITDAMLAQFDLYREDPSSTPTWVHLTTRPPPSGKRTFAP